MSTTFTALAANIEQDAMATAATSFYMVANIGTTVGMASTSVILQAVLEYGLDRKLGDNRDKAEVGATRNPFLSF